MTKVETTYNETDPLQLNGADNLIALFSGFDRLLLNNKILYTFEVMWALLQVADWNFDISRLSLVTYRKT